MDCDCACRFADSREIAVAGIETESLPASSGARSSAPSKAVSPVDRDSRLDVLRAIAVLMVMCRHLVPPATFSSATVERAITWSHRVGWMGVDLFFVLSGFLVSGLLFREYQKHGDIHVGRFLIRRGFKIYPSYYVFLFVTFFALQGTNSAPSRTQLWQHVLFVQNYAERQPGQWIHTWSLAVEEHFYILLGLLFAWWLARTKVMPTMRQATGAMLAVTAVVSLLRVVNYFVFDTQTNLEALLRFRMFTTHLRIDALLFGVWLAYMSHCQKAIWNWMTARRWWWLAIGLVLLAPSMKFENQVAFTSLVGFAIYFVGMGGLVVFAATGSANGKRLALWWRPLAFMGTYSYSIYLWHLAVKRWSVPVLTRVLGSEPGYWTATAVYVGGSVVVGIVMATLIEFPFLRMRDSMFPSRSRSGSVLSART